MSNLKRFCKIVRSVYTSFLTFFILQTSSIFFAINFYKNNVGISEAFAELKQSW